MRTKFPAYRQLDEMDCGPSCLRIVSKYYGKEYSLDHLRDACNTGRTGSSLLHISEAAERLGFRTIGAKIEFADLEQENLFPCIAYWYQKHFIVVYKIKNNKVYVSDPSCGLVVYTKKEFLKGWASADESGIILSLEPTPEFYLNKGNTVKPGQNRKLKNLLHYLFQHKKLFIQVMIGLVVSSLLQLALPFLTQSIVDVGIAQHNLSFIHIILIAQLVIFLGKTSVEIMRGIILLHISSRINIRLISDFFIKLMKLPLGFFDAKMAGDILQRIADHQRVEAFLTTGSLNVLFSCINLIVFGGVLAYYNIPIFLTFLFGSLAYVGWILFFIRKRAIIDYKRFNQLSENQENNLELIYGMQEIKLHNAEKKKRWQWEYLQVKLVKINLRGLSLKQAQMAGSSLINELKNILITFLGAKFVLDGQISLGVMLSVSYISGQLNAPIAQLLDFIQSYQDALLSVERINEIHRKPDEESKDQLYADVPADGDIVIDNLSFKYDTSSQARTILKNINLTIPRNKVTAIVGSSGSGKTTLLKLLLKFYEPQDGDVVIGNSLLRHIDHKKWRNHCGSVMQEGFIFSDSIANNIAVGDETYCEEELSECTRVANIHDYIGELPLKLQTKIGPNGFTLSTGQKQRILIARALYKKPEFLFFDEATSALDANNERIIMQNLNQVFKGRTVVVIAHRLSTVKNADQIVVLDKGEIAEIGDHAGLVSKKGLYYELIKNQLELGA